MNTLSENLTKPEDITILKIPENIEVVIFDTGGLKVYLDTYNHINDTQGVTTLESNVPLFKIMKNESTHTFGHVLNDQYRVISANKKTNNLFTIISYIIIS